jgi:hypothetical protein
MLEQTPPDLDIGVDASGHSSGPSTPVGLRRTRVAQGTCQRRWCSLSVIAPTISLSLIIVELVSCCAKRLRSARSASTLMSQPAADQPDLAIANIGSWYAPADRDNAGERHAPHNLHAWRAVQFSWVIWLNGGTPQLSLLPPAHILLNAGLRQAYNCSHSSISVKLPGLIISTLLAQIRGRVGLTFDITLTCASQVEKRQNLIWFDFNKNLFIFCCCFLFIFRDDFRWDVRTKIVY